MQPHRPVFRASRSRRGVALVMFAMLVFAFFAVAGLAIDMGTANLTQQQMQNAVDSAAIEGVRLRNAEPTPDKCDEKRRPRVSQLVRLVFDDDLHPTGNGAFVTGDQDDDPVEADSDADQLRIGAGPGLQVYGQVGDTKIGTSSGAGVWDDPVLRKNLPNRRWGDMVSGMYRDGAPHVELGSSYDRPDFEAGAMTTADTQIQGLAFLVRMRRTGLNHPEDSEANVSYRGRPVPLLFSQGSLIQKSDGEYDARVHGITVRATAIAVGRPALQASPPPTRADGTPILDEARFGHTTAPYDPAESPVNQPMMGLYPFVLDLDFWVSRVTPPVDGEMGTWHQLVQLQVQPDGALHELVGPAADGVVVLNPDGTPSVRGRFAAYGRSVGQQVDAQAPIALDDEQERGYVAIYADIAGPTGPVSRIVGYGFCRAERDVVDPNVISFWTGIDYWSGGGEAPQVKVWVAPNGASARLAADAPTLSGSEWESVLQHNRRLAYPVGDLTYDNSLVRYGTLLAPTLAR